MKDQKIKDMVGGVKTYFVQMPKKNRNIVIGVLAGIVAIAIAATLVMNYNSAQYKILYPGIEQGEKNTVFQLLQEQGVAVEMNGQGEIMVPTNRYDELLLQLAGQGYPQSALSYDVFSSFTGLTATESERKQGLLFQLQNRIQSTLERINTVKGATVTITIPDTSDYVWQQTEAKEPSQASVLLKLQGNQGLTPDQVDGVRKLVATSCPNMKPEDVMVVDAATSVELYGTSATSNGDSVGFSSSQNLELESMAQQRLEDNIIRLLSPRYGTNGVVAAARVTLNYDKMITEENQMQPNADGTGNTTHTEGNYSLDGTQTFRGIVGEQNNTDFPGYGYNDAAGEEGITNMQWSTDYAYSYIKTQIEKNNADVERATISVMVKEENLTQALRTELIGLISNGVDIPVGQISISSFTVPTTENVEQPETLPGDILAMFSTLPWWVWLAAGAGFILIVGTLAMLLFIRKKNKAKVRAAERKMQEDAVRRVTDEISEYKKQLSDAAKGGTSEVDEAILTEVKDFAKNNPEVTANLLRNWLKDS